MAEIEKIVSLKLLLSIPSDRRVHTRGDMECPQSVFCPVLLKSSKKQILQLAFVNCSRIGSQLPKMTTSLLDHLSDNVYGSSCEYIDCTLKLIVIHLLKASDLSRVRGILRVQFL